MWMQLWIITSQTAAMFLKCSPTGQLQPNSGFTDFNEI